MPSKGRYLRDALKREVFPFLAESKFQRLKRIKGRSPMLMDFNRISGQQVDCLCIQFDKYGRARFKVLLAQGSAAGVRQYTGEFVPGPELRTYMCRGEKAILSSRRNPSALVKTGVFGMGWFSMKWARLIGPERSAVNTARRFISLFSECEEWWQNKEYGPHLFRNRVSEGIQRRLKENNGNLDEGGPNLKAE